MRMSSIGIHVMMQPASSNMHISLETIDPIKATISTTCLMNKCIHHETYIGHDHIHVLVEAPNEECAILFVPEAISSMTNAIHAIQPEFEFGEGIHITLLPPWHIDILAAFVRDQQHYHLTKTVQQELDQIFKPGLIGTVETQEVPTDVSGMN